MEEGTFWLDINEVELKGLTVTCLNCHREEGGDSCPDFYCRILMNPTPEGNIRIRTNIESGEVQWTSVGLEDCDQNWRWMEMLLPRCYYPGLGYQILD